MDIIDRLLFEWKSIIEILFFLIFYRIEFLKIFLPNYEYLNINLNIILSRKVILLKNLYFQ
jgi:hypothetical protein